eukprot:7378647-Prymnesium_polylepis.1
MGVPLCVCCVCLSSLSVCVCLSSGLCCVPIRPRGAGGIDSQQRTGRAHAKCVVTAVRSGKKQPRCASELSFQLGTTKRRN